MTHSQGAARMMEAALIDFFGSDGGGNFAAPVTFTNEAPGGEGPHGKGGPFVTYFAIADPLTRPLTV